MSSEKNLRTPELGHRRAAQFRRWHKWGGVTAGLLLLVALAASLVPALRILKMDPAETLRRE